MIMYSNKFANWLQHTIVGMSSDKSYRHALLKEDLTHRDETIEELKRYIQEAHEDARRHLRELAGYSLNPFEEHVVDDDPAKGYPESLHMVTLKGYFGEIFAAIIAQHFSPFEITNWEVPAFLFRFHVVELQHIEAINQIGGEIKRRPGRTGDDFLAFQRDSSGNIVRVLYGEAKCTADHETDMIAEAYKKASESPIVDFLRIIEVLREKNDPLTEQWVDAIRRARGKNAQYERYDLVSYVCGRHPKRDSVWLPTDKPHANYTAKRRLEAVEAHLNEIEALIQEVYPRKQSTENGTTPDRTQEGKVMAQPSKETLNIASRLRENLAGTTIPKNLAKLYSQHTLLGAGGQGLFHWAETETTHCLDDALRLLEAAFAEREGGNDNWRESVRRAGEILEWLSHPQLNPDRLPTRFLAAAAYQLAGYPARSSGLLNTAPGEENESTILKFLLKAEFPHLLGELAKYWANTASPRRNERSVDWQNPDELSNGLQQHILKETVGALGILCATMRWGEEPRIERAIAKLQSIGNVLLHGNDAYSWLLAKLCVEIAIVYTRTSMRYNLMPLSDKMTGPGVTALKRYLHQCYQANKALAWPSQIKGIEKLVSESSFVLCTPTGSGKTTIAELAILQSLFSGSSEDQKNTDASLAIYIVPSRALAAEVEAKLSRVLRNLNEPPINVTGLYGGTDWGPTDVWLTAENQTVLICTHEKAEALIRFLGPYFLKKVSLVIIDEAHLVQFDAPLKKLQQADNRSLRLEALGSRLFTYLKQNHGRVIALSAVAAGIEESLAGWATGQRNASPAKTSYRSVRQLIGSLECLPNHSFEIRYDLLDGASLKYREGRTEEQPYIPEPFPPLPHVDEGYKTGTETRLRPYLFWAAMHLASRDESGRQHTVLISVTQNISGYAGDFLDLLDKTWAHVTLPLFFQPPQEEEKTELWEKCLRSCEDYFGRDSKEYKLLQKGIVVHHGRMPGLLARSLIDLVQDQVVRLVLATSTLSEGVNLPFETILIPSIRRSGAVMSAREFGNLIGRAGRPGYGTEGRSLVILDGENSYSAREYRKEYENLIAQFKAQGQAQNGTARARSPLAELLLHLEKVWRHIPGVGDSGDFLNWLEQIEPLKIKDDLDENSGLDAIETIDTLDSLLLSGIVEIEQLAREEVSADVLEEQLRQIWKRSYAYYAATEESRLQEIFVRRGRALKVKIYPSTYQRRRLYRTGLPPRSGNQLLGLYPSLKQTLMRGDAYALWDEKDRFNYIQAVVEQLTSLSHYKRDEKVGRSNINWREVLQWWLNPTSVKKKTPINVSAWYKYVSDNFGFRFNWGLGSVIALAADEALNGELLEPSLENWPLLGLPWIVLWLKELIIWGTLEPVAAYLLSKNMEGTRASAEEVAKVYYQEQSPEQDPDELLNASTLRDWAMGHYSQEQKLPLLRPPDRMQVRLLQDFSKVEEREWKVLPVEVDSTLQWFDPAGTLLATCGRPSIWSESFLNSYDFILDVNEKMVSSESYTAFR
jgi:hypothetical protein